MLVFSGLILIVLLFLTRSYIADFILINFGTCATARLTAEADKTSEAAYRFRVDEKSYYGDLLVEPEKNSPGRNICVIYYSLIPSINRPASYFSYEDRSCFCN